jgi:hypothetical protein
VHTQASCALYEHSTCARSGRRVSCARPHPTGVKLGLTDCARAHARRVDTTCAQVVQALRASSRPPRVLDLRGRSVCNALLLRSTSAKAQTVLGLDETSAAPTSSARVSHAMADTIDTSSAAVQSRGCMEIGIHTSGGTCIHSVRILGPYARCAAKKISLERAAQLSFLKSYFIRVFVNANRSADQTR